jgi:CBS domain-containing protein
MANATVQEVMTPSPSAIESNENAIEAARMMMAENIGSLPVVNGDELVGMVTDRDLVLQVMAKDLDPNVVPVSQVCTEDPVVATPDEPLDAALGRMAAEQVRRLPVVKGTRLVGILAQADVARSADSKSTGQLVEKISEES